MPAIREFELDHFIENWTPIRGELETRLEEITRETAVNELITKAEEKVEKGEKKEAKKLREEAIRTEVIVWLKEGYVNFRRSANKDKRRSRKRMKNLFDDHFSPVFAKAGKRLSDQRKEQIFMKILKKLEEKGLIRKNTEKTYFGAKGKWPIKAPEKIVNTITNIIMQKEERKGLLPL